MPSDKWDDFAPDWDSRSDVHQYADHAFESWNRRVAPLVENMREMNVLDFGCGTGLLTEKFASQVNSVVAVDTSVKMLNVLKGKIRASGLTNVKAIVTTISPDSIASDPALFSDFDLVIASSVCNFLPDYEETLCTIARTMKPGGVFVQWDWIDDMPADRIRRAYDRAGLKYVSIGEEFAMDGDNAPMQVIMGIGQLCCWGSNLEDCHYDRSKMTVNH